MANAIGDRWSGDGLRHVTDGGGEHSGNDEAWEEIYKHWDREGVPTDLILLARPLLEGSRTQRRNVEKFLEARQGDLQSQPQDRTDLLAMLDLYGMKDAAIASLSTMGSDDALLKQWDADMGSLNKRPEAL